MKRFHRWRLAVLCGSIFLIGVTALTVLLGMPFKASGQDATSGSGWLTITLAPTAFPPTEIGAPAPLMDATITNNAHDDIYIRDTVLGDTTNFSMPASENGCKGIELRRYRSCHLHIYFQPQATGSIDTRLNVFYRYGAYVSTIVRGEGYIPHLELSTTQVDFGSKTINTGPETRSVRITNNALIPVAVQSITASGAPFDAAQACVATIPAGGFCDLLVSFDPTEAHSFIGSVVIRDAFGNDQEIDLSGDGIAPGVPDIGLSTTEIDFGSIIVGSTSSQLPVTLVSSGQADLIISDISVSEPFALVTIPGSSCVKTLVPGEHCTLQLTFSPTAGGDQQGEVTITDNAADTPQTVTLDGLGVEPGEPAADLDPISFDFGQQTVGTTSEVAYILLTNAGEAPLTISAVATTGAFTQENNCLGIIPAAGRCAIAVSFAPVVVGEAAGAITITDDASDSPQTVSLEGNGTQSATPQASLSATSLDFGAQAAGSTTTQELTLTNTGDSDLEIGLTSLDGEGVASFSKSDQCRESVLEPGVSCKITVIFSPIDVGDYAATLSISDNAAGSPQVVALTGSGSIPSSGGCSLIIPRH